MVVRVVSLFTARATASGWLRIIRAPPIPGIADKSDLPQLMMLRLVTLKVVSCLSTLQPNEVPNSRAVGKVRRCAEILTWFINSYSVSCSGQPSHQNILGVR